MDIVKNSNIRFVSNKKIFYIISSVLIVISIISLLFRGFNYGIDFAGGTLIQLDFKQGEVSVGDIRNVLGEMNFAGSTIQALSDNEFIIKTTQIELAERQQLMELIKDKIGPFEVLRVEMVGPVIGQSLKNLTALAIIFAFLGMIIYITIRFQFKYAITSILALAHDVIITLGVFSILQKEITIPIIAAILTVVGYSINNTIIIFDRLRENLKSRLRIPLEGVIDLSINQTLNRTINTALTTLLPVIALYIFGGTLSDFALVLLIGISIGTYSSICLAAPLLMEFTKKGKILSKIPNVSGVQKIVEQEGKVTKKVKSKKKK